VGKCKPNKCVDDRRRHLGIVGRQKFGLNGFCFLLFWISDPKSIFPKMQAEEQVRALMSWGLIWPVNY